MATTVGKRSASAQIREAYSTVDLLTGRLQRFQDFLHNYSSSQLDRLHVKLESAESFMQKYDEAYKMLKSAVVQEEAAKLDEALIEFEDSWEEAVSCAKGLLRTTSTSNIERHSTETRMNESRIEAHIKLPTLGLPHFDGHYENWTEFSDSFDGMVGGNINLTSSQKLQYLKSALKGEAAKIVQSLKICDANYEIAWDLLRKRYELKNLIVKGHLCAIMDLAKMNKESADQLRFISDTVTKSTRGLEAVGVSINNWDPLLIYIITERLDPNTLREWETLQTPESLPTWKQFSDFLDRRCSLLEALQTKSTADPRENRKSTEQQAVRKPSKVTLAAINGNCEICSKNHAAAICPTWSSIAPDAKRDLAKKNRLCYRCLNHWNFKHRCRNICSKCSGPHHAHFHEEVDKSVESTVQAGASKSTGQAGPSQASLSTRNETSTVLLSTIQVRVWDANGRVHLTRAILDSGSQANIISNQLCDKLRLERTAENTTVCGINQSTCLAAQSTSLVIGSRLSDYRMNISCTILEDICGNLPQNACHSNNWNIPKKIRLADPQFDTPGRVDILIGAEHFWNVLCKGTFKLGMNLPVLQRTCFGYVVAGPSGIVSPTKIVKCHFSHVEIDRQLERFWVEQECDIPKNWSKEELLCEEKFKETVKRNEDGRFSVEIPLKENVDKLGDSRLQAERRFFALERKLARNTNFKELYQAFLTEYEDMGHMQQVDLAHDPDGLVSYYAPHHGVLKEESTTTKLRVVFDCSAKTTTGISFNDIQMVGPTIQEDLLSIVLRFRRHAYVITGDIAKMYRQVQVSPEQRSLHRILWRSQPTEPLRTYELKTVTYGTAAAAFLVIRCLHALAEEHQNISPQAAAVLKTDFYVDDLLTGGEDRDELKTMCKELVGILKSGCFDLRKWNSNDEDLLRELTQKKQADEFLDLSDNQSTKTLGLYWAPRVDSLQYRIHPYEGTKNVTKRIMMSRIAQIYDPLGLLAPCTVIGKMMLQRLWLEGLAWDDVLPSKLMEVWMNFENELSELNLITVPRRVIAAQCERIEIHGFADASEAAYGACIYIRSSNSNGNVHTQLLCSKSKVAPLKTVTIPRLELCGAILLVRLVKKVIAAWKTPIHEITLWTDSTIVLGWLNTPPAQMKTYVGNRVAEIQALEVSHVWRHVPTASNPADLVSRGIWPRKLKVNDLWWFGPTWLKEDPLVWPLSCVSTTEIPELRAHIRVLMVKNSNDDIFDRFSDFSRLQRVTAYILRFVRNASSRKYGCNTGPLSAVELKQSLLCLVKLAQKETFSEDIESLGRTGCVEKGSKLLALNPFLDSLGIIRVGGRISAAELPMDRMHPMVLCSKHALTRLLFEAEHKRLLHAGPQMILASIRQRIWPIAGRILAKATVRKCIRCFRADPKSISPLMGNLPSQRLQADFAFQNVGVDFAGPIMIKDRKGRGARTSKHYICLFICMAVKAIHLELVSELTTKAFIFALQRFVARRGKPISIHSDNATNFVGANAELKQLVSFLKAEQNAIGEAIANEGIEWKFIPSSAPHYGGLWERGVKSVKHHLRRITGNSLFTYEEYQTLLAQVESILNSRPLCPLSDDPNDFEFLTPSHFCIGRPITRIPEEDITNVKENRLSHYQHIQFVLQHFWKRWSLEYLPELQIRQKWKINTPALKLGSLVMIRDDNLPPMKWSLGRICELHPGKDGVIRVVTVRTALGFMKRPAVKLCPLPMDEVASVHGATGGVCTSPKR